MQQGNEGQMEPISELLKFAAHAPIRKSAMTNLGVLNEAYAYAKPSAFSRGMRIDLNGLVILLISGTASIDEQGVSVHVGDFRAQMRRTLENIAGLLASEGASWHDVAICAILSVTMMLLMKKGRRFIKSRGWIRCRPRREFRRRYAGLNC
jgi:enamine deaminase RidA (YjgF/YER057c/UK114 family)